MTDEEKKIAEKKCRGADEVEVQEDRRREEKAGQRQTNENQKDT